MRLLDAQPPDPDYTACVYRMGGWIIEEELDDYDATLPLN